LFFKSLVLRRRRGDGKQAWRSLDEKTMASDGEAGAAWTRRRRAVWWRRWIFRTADLVVRRNRGCVVLLVTLRITCACGRGPRDTCARRPVPSCRPLIPCALDGSVTKCVSGQAPGLPGPRLAKNGVACYGWPRPDAARGPGVVSADQLWT
jgi:hypothetical protein